MQLPSIDRIQGLRPVAAESASLATGRVVPVAPTNVSQSSVLPVEPTPSVINLVNQGEKPSSGEGVYSSVPDPVRRSADAASEIKDWTIKRPEPEKVEDPPPEPLSKILLDHIKSLWLASASAIQVQEQVKEELDLTKPGPSAPQAALAAEAVTYSPSKVNGTEKPLT